jgi:hypothetical protein
MTRRLPPRSPTGAAIAPLGAPRRRQSGQTLVLMTLFMVAILGFLGVIIDGGYLWSQQRIVQNSTDSAAEAGAIVLAQRLSGATAPAGGWDGAVNAKVTAAANAAGLTVTAAYYTDICGIPLTPGGHAALNWWDGSYAFEHAVKVGSGFLPADTGTTPDCPSLTVGPPAGVLVMGTKTVNTFFARVLGVNSMSVSTAATAVTGWLQGICDSSNGQPCGLLPLTVPVAPLACNSNGTVGPAPAWLGTSWQSGPTYAIPLCKEANGNIGWIDWTPPSGGTSEVVDAILHPANHQFNLPTWQFVSQTGNPNSSAVEDAINTYNGQIVLIPMFDETCSADPDFAQVATPPLYGCPAGSVGGHGQRNWYRFPAFAAFRLCGGTNVCTVSGPNGTTTYTQGAYTQANNGEMCTAQGTQEWSGGGCLVGQFVNIIRSGPVAAVGGGGSSPSKVVGVQLIK